MWSKTLGKQQQCSYLALFMLLGATTSTSTGQEPKLRFSREAKDCLFSVCFSHDGKLLAGACGDGSVRVWNVATGTLEMDLKGHKSQVRSVSFHPKQHLLASGGADGTIKLWELPGGNVRKSLLGPAGPAGVESLAFSNDGKLLASSGFGQGGKSEAVMIWDVESGEKVGGVSMMFRGGGVTVHSVAFQGDRKVLALGAHYHEVTLWDMEKERTQATFTGHKKEVFAVSFSGDGKTLASGSGDGTVRLWDPFTNREKLILKGHTEWVHGVAVRPDGRIVASGSHDKTVKLWDTATGKEKATLTGPTEWVFAVAFSKDGRLLASVGGGHGTQGELMLWEIPE